MRIAIPISRFEKSGGIRTLTVLANGLTARGHEVIIVVPRGEHYPCFPLNDEINIKIVRPNLGRVKHFSGLLKKIQLIYGMPSSVNIAIANAFMTAYSVSFHRITHRVKHFFYFIQGFEPSAFGEWEAAPFAIKMLKRYLAGLTYRLGFTCIVNSQWLAKMLLDSYGTPSIVAPLGVDTAIFRPMQRTLDPHSKTVIMTIGSINPVKRYDLFIEVLCYLQPHLECEALIATANEKLTGPENISYNIVNPENDFELAKIYNQASLFLSTSANEGFGLPLLEAMACGIPVVTTDSGGIRDFCEDGFNCRIVHSASPEDLSQAVLEICSDQELRDHLIQNGLVTASEWPWTRFVDTFDSLFQELT